MPIHIIAAESGGDSSVANRIRAALAKPTATVICPCCSQPCAASELERRRDLNESVCPACANAAARLGQRFRDEAQREYREFCRELPKMILDLRSGNDMPTFYRGFE